MSGRPPPSSATSDASWVPWVVAAAAFALCAYRAATQSFTFDESTTYTKFIGNQPLGRLFLYDSNNHIINTLLEKATTLVFTPTELTLRLPALFGAFLYLTAQVILTGLVTGSVASNRQLARTILLVLVSFHPLVLDFLSVARGYGLALGFLSWALVVMLADLRALSEGARYRQRRPRIAGGAFLIMFSLCSNPAFVYAAGALGAGYFVVQRWTRSEEGSWAEVARALALFSATCVFAALVLLLPYIPEMGMNHLYWGEATLTDSLRDLINATLFHAATSSVSIRTMSADSLLHLPDNALQGFLCGSFASALLVAMTAAVLGALTLTALRLHHSGRDGSAAIRIGFLCAFTLTLSTGMLVASHLLVSLKYPVDRTALYVVPLFTLMLAGAGALSTRPGRLTVPIGALLGVLYLGQVEVSYYRTWRYDSSSRRAFELVDRLAAAKGMTEARVGGVSLYGPTFDFYRLTTPGNHVRPFLIRKNPLPEDVDFFFYNQDDVAAPDPSRFETVLRDPLSGVIVAQRRD